MQQAERSTRQPNDRANRAAVHGISRPDNERERTKAKDTRRKRKRKYANIALEEYSTAVQRSAHL
jgi:hypothetical protein